MGNNEKETQQATLYDVARDLGVSIATVSRTLNDKPGVGKKVREKVWEAVNRLNYTPNAAARDLSGAKSDTVGCVFQDLHGAWLTTIFRGALFRLANHNYNIVTALSTKAGDEYDVPNSLLAAQRIAGLIWLDPRILPITINEVKKSCKGPIVAIQNYSDNPTIDSVSIENVSGAYMAVKHLLDIGRKNIMLISGNDNTVNQQKLQGARLAFAEHNLLLPPESILNGLDNGEHAQIAFNKFLDSGRPLPDAIFGFNDDMALAIMYMLYQRGYKIPEDVALVGFDGIPETERAKLTTIRTPMCEVGSMAAQILVERLESPQAERFVAQHILLKGHLDVRGSTVPA